MEKKHDIAFQDDEIVYVSTGDGTTSQGEFWEGLTTACVNKLPVMFCVEDNGYAISVPVSVQMPEGSISKALSNFPGLKVIECDGNCPIESYAAAREAERIFDQNGAVLIHAHVTRPYSHSMSDDQRMYRTEEELEIETKKDVINSYPETLLQLGLLSDKELEDIKDKISKQVREAIDKAVETPWPEKETALDHLFSHDHIISSDEFNNESEVKGKEDVPMAQAINSVLRNEVKEILIRVFGEDVADFTEVEKYEKGLKGKGGVFKISSGVQKAGIENQVFNSPLAEANIVGRAIGMAMRGLKPVVEIQFFDYIWTAFMHKK